MMPIQRLEAAIHGRVQGVGFRYFVYKEATKRNLSGYVRNTTNETVEIVAEGNPKDLIELLKVIETKRGYISVDEVQKIILPPTGEFHGFSIKQ